MWTVDRKLGSCILRLSAIGGMRPLDRDQWAVGCLFGNLETNRS